MVELIRNGSGIVLVVTGHEDRLLEYFGKDALGGRYTLNEAFGKAGEENTILVFAEDEAEERIEEAVEGKHAIILNGSPADVLSRFINDDLVKLVKKTEIMNRSIIIRAIGDLDKVFQELKEDYNGTEGNILDFLHHDYDQGVIIALTDKSLNKQVELQDFYQNKCLLVDSDYYSVFKDLRANALKYLNTGIGNCDWYELEIKIYDVFGEFKLHLERLIHVLTDLEVGIILGQTWSKDYPKMLMSVDVYRVRFFTFYLPEKIKRILLGLEHLEDGTRIVDYDLFHNRKKISWRQAVTERRLERSEASNRYREEILAGLSPEGVQELLELEAKILETRNRER
jgi:hypothetical protein